MGALRLGTYRSIWAAPEVELSPALKFLRARQRAEISPIDARRLGLGHGDRVTVGTNGTRVGAHVAVRDAVPPGTVFLQNATAEDSATALEAGVVEIAPA